MQAVLTMETQVRKRKPKTKKPVVSVTYRLDTKVKDGVEEMADTVGRSENLQVEYCIKVAYLHYRGINIYGMNDLQIANKFDETTQMLDSTECQVVAS